MQLIGRKLYIAIAPNLVYGVEKLVIPPASMGLTLDPTAPMRLFDVVEVMGERQERLLGYPIDMAYGHSINQVIETNACWVPRQ